MKNQTTQGRRKVGGLLRAAIFVTMATFLSLGVSATNMSHWQHNFTASQGVGVMDTLWTQSKMANGSSGKQRQFCSARTDSTYFSDSHCGSALSLTSGRKRVLQLHKQIGELQVQFVNETNSTKPKAEIVSVKTKNMTKDEYKKYWHDMEHRIKKWNEQHANNTTNKQGNDSGVDGEADQSKFYNYFKNYRNQSDIEREDPLWVVNLTSDKFGYSQPAIIDPDFPYMQISPSEFDGIFKNFPGFQLVIEKNVFGQEGSKLKKYVSEQDCEVLFGCYEQQNFTLSGVFDKNSSRLNMTYQPLDFLIKSYTANGQPQCTLGITTCENGEHCPTTLGQVFLKNFDTILDYKSNSISMRVAPKDEYKGNVKNCWGTHNLVKPRTIYQQFEDWVMHYFNMFLYLSKPANLIYELWENQNTTVLEIEVAVAVASLLIPVMLLYFASIFGFIQVVVWAVNWHNGSHIKFLF